MRDPHHWPFSQQFVRRKGQFHHGDTEITEKAKEMFSCVILRNRCFARNDAHVSLRALRVSVVNWFLDGFNVEDVRSKRTQLNE
jgi:hypothetical protein